MFRVKINNIPQVIECLFLCKSVGVEVLQVLKHDLSDHKELASIIRLFNQKIIQSLLPGDSVTQARAGDKSGWAGETLSITFPVGLQTGNGR
jgi:hypothetical protein